MSRASLLLPPRPPNPSPPLPPPQKNLYIAIRDVSRAAGADLSDRTTMHKRLERIVRSICSVLRKLPYLLDNDARSQARELAHKRLGRVKNQGPSAPPPPPQPSPEPSPLASSWYQNQASDE